MPRTYKRKTITHYSQEELQEAIKEIKCKNCSVYSTAKKYRIPYDTLRRWVTKPPSKEGSGRRTVLTKIEEHSIVNAIQFTASCGYPFGRSDVVNIVQGYLKSTGKTNLFPNNCPGPDWLRNFVRRWEEELGKGETGLMSNPSAKILTKRSIEEFFKKYESILNEHKLWDQPDRVFNAGEMKLRVFPAENKNADEKAGNADMDTRQSVYSVLFCVSVAGCYIAPLTVYRAKNLDDTWTTGGPDGAVYAAAASGRVQDDAFERWFEMFIGSVSAMGLARPVLLIHNGQGCHLTYGIVRRAIENQIIILCLPPNSSHAIQPLDVGVLEPLKQSWENIIKDWYKKSNMHKVSKATFPILLRKLTERLAEEHGRDGFRESGIFPPNRAVFDKRITEYAVVNEELLCDSEQISTNHRKPTSQAALEAGPSTSKANQSVAPIISSETETSIASPSTHVENAKGKNALSPVQIMARYLMRRGTRKRTCTQMKSGEVLSSNRFANRLSLLEEINQDIEHINKNQKIAPKLKIKPEEESSSNSFSCNQNIQIGKWVEVKFPLKKTVWTYVGIIISQNNQDYVVKFAKKSGSYYVFPENDDVCQVDASQIVKVFRDP